MTVLLVATLTGLLFCGPMACKTKSLEQGGAYAPGAWETNADNSIAFKASQAPDPTFYKIDAAYDLAYAAIDAIFSFEKNNRAYLWSLSPNIKHTLDDIRPKAVEANTRYLKARRVYISNPTPAGLSDLVTTLSQIQNLSAAASNAIPK